MKLYLVTREDLSAPAQAVQSCHAALELSRRMKIADGETIVLLSVRDEQELIKLASKAAA